ncbi:MAG: helix-turn-helix domain-containing protein [Candidatus Eremiobacteraeota bacterium]|nr:helix-turn-helix domain-containing protein [Candidatus Eremiobacteraeota bacterium]
MYAVAEEPHSLLEELDRKRRAELRSFLTHVRSRLHPEEVGLPEVGRRRVPGLRRPEVAELVGVSEDWYRWFESGRPISVSSKFLSRLADALRLTPFEEVALYRLALPDLYRAAARCAGVTSANAQPAGVRIRTTYPLAVCS